MAKKNKKKKPDSKELSESEKLDLQLRKQTEIEGIVDLTETRNPKPDKKKEAIIIQLVGGKTIQLGVLAPDWQSHDPQYTVKFYTPVFRLLNITGDPSSFKDRFRKEIAYFKNEVIWSRFGKEMDELRRKNKYGGYYVRRHWHYQGLNDNGIVKLQQFIGEATDVMNDCSEYYEFRQRMYKEYGVPYQTQISF